MIIYLLVGLLLGTIFSFLVLKLRFTDTYISKAQFSELEKKFSEIQLPICLNPDQVFYLLLFFAQWGGRILYFSNSSANVLKEDDV